jgi:hypothetical protein
MPNYRLSLDMADLQTELSDFKLREYNLPFTVIFVEAENPDAACHKVRKSLLKLILQQSDDISTRILCEKIKKYLRIDKIDAL